MDEFKSKNIKYNVSIQQMWYFFWKRSLLVVGRICKICFLPIFQKYTTIFLKKYALMPRMNLNRPFRLQHQ